MRNFLKGTKQTLHLCDNGDNSNIFSLKQLSLLNSFPSCFRHPTAVPSKTYGSCHGRSHNSVVWTHDFINSATPSVCPNLAFHLFVPEINQITTPDITEFVFIE